MIFFFLIFLQNLITKSSSLLKCTYNEQKAAITRHRRIDGFEIKR